MKNAQSHSQSSQNKGMPQADRNEGANDFVESIERSAKAVVDQAVGTLEEKAVSLAQEYERKAVDAVKNIDQLPEFLRQTVDQYPLVAIGAAFGVGMALRMGQDYLPANVVQSAAREGGKMLMNRLAKSAFAQFSS